MLNLFQLREREENKKIKFNLLMLIIGSTFVGSVMIVMSFDAIGFYGDKLTGLAMFLVGIAMGLLPSYKMYKEEEQWKTKK